MSGNDTQNHVIPQQVIILKQINFTNIVHICCALVEVLLFCIFPKNGAESIVCVPKQTIETCTW